MPAVTSVDHLIVGVADLDAGIDWLEQRTGVRAVFGGTHPGRGTRNALLAFGGRQYLEIVSIDPAQGSTQRQDLLAHKEPRLIGWAAATTSVDEVAKRAAAAALTSTPPRPGSRARPDGRQLQWTTIAVQSTLAAGGIDPIPFFIQWAAGSVHPSHDSPKGCELTSLEFEHPDADALQRTLSGLGITAVVRRGAAVRMAASVKAPKGTLLLA
jgi:hypothetical protein